MKMAVTKFILAGALLFSATLTLTNITAFDGPIPFPQPPAQSMQQV